MNCSFTNSKDAVRTAGSKLPSFLWLIHCGPHVLMDSPRLLLFILPKGPKNWSKQEGPRAGLLALLLATKQLQTGRAGPAGTRSSVAPPQPMLALQSTQLPPLMSYVQSCPSVSECPEQQGSKRLCCQTVPCQALSHRNGRRSLFWSRVVPVTAAPSVPSDGQAKRRYFLIQQRASCSAGRDIRSHGKTLQRSEVS